MSIFAKPRSPVVNILAASVMILGAAAPAGPSFARGAGPGGGHAALTHAAPSIPSLPSSTADISAHAAPASESKGRMDTFMAHGDEHASHAGSPTPPADGHTARTGDHTARADKHDARSHRHHHDHHKTPPPSTQQPTTQTTTTVTTTPDTTSTTSSTTTSGSATTTAQTPAASTSSSTASGTLTSPTDALDTGGTLAPDTRTGGGGDTLAGCMQFWQADTHMSRTEWRETCVRTLNGLDAGGGVDRYSRTAPLSRPATASPTMR